MLKLGLVINPYAGIGGTVALKGSDGRQIQDLAVALGARSRVVERVTTALAVLQDVDSGMSICTYPGIMGGDVCEKLGLSPSIVGVLNSNDTGPADTQNAVKLICRRGVDLLLFAGGDGTARDVCDAVSSEQLVLGIPCGVKMQSGVFAVSPRAVSEILLKLLEGQLVSAVRADVRDLDEDAFRNGEIRACYHGEMKIPEAPRYMQQVKSGNPESETIAMDELAAYVVECMDPDATYIMGSGTTIAKIMEHLGLPNTLLGIDVIRAGELLQADATERHLLALIDATTRMIVTVIGGQGHIFGRGNQQLSARVISRLDRSHIQVVATRGKLAALEQRPLLVDTGDPELDESLAGYVTVITGYEDEVVYRIG